MIINLRRPNNRWLLLPVIVVSLALLFPCLSPSSVVLGESKLMVGYPGYFGLVDLEVEGFRLGLTRTAEGELGLGLALGNKRALSLGNWDLSPFLVGTTSSLAALDPEDIAGGLQVSFFDYKIGGWALSSTSRGWLDSSGYRLGGSGSYTLGNLSLDYDLQLDAGEGGKSRWYPVREGGYWTSLVGGSLSRFGNLQGSYLRLSGGKKLPFGEKSLRWSQGLSLNSTDGPLTLGLVGKLSYGKSTFFALVEDMGFAGWGLRLAGEGLSIGFIQSSVGGSNYGLSLAYRGDRRLELEVLGSRNRAERTINLTLRW